MIATLDATEFWPSSPAVMLSPKAMNDVVDNFGGLSTVTMNEQLSVRWSASLAWQVTVLWPTEKDDPGAGVQVVVTGGWPFTTLGGVNITAVDPPSKDCAVCEAGQVILGASGVTGGGG